MSASAPRAPPLDAGPRRDSSASSLTEAIGSGSRIEASQPHALRPLVLESPTRGADPLAAAAEAPQKNNISPESAKDEAPSSPDSDQRSPHSTSPLLRPSVHSLAVSESILISSQPELDVELGASRSDTSFSVRRRVLVPFQLIALQTNAEICVICCSRVKSKRTLECGHSFCGDVRSRLPCHCETGFVLPHRSEFRSPPSHHICARDF